MKEYFVCINDSNLLFEKNVIYEGEEFGSEQILISEIITLAVNFRKVRDRVELLELLKDGCTIAEDDWYLKLSFQEERFNLMKGRKK